MKVRVLDGRYAGEVRDFAPATARMLIARGRAVLPEVDVTLPAPVEAVTSTAERIRLPAPPPGVSESINKGLPQPWPNKRRRR